MRLPEFLIRFGTAAAALLSVSTSLAAWSTDPTVNNPACTTVARKDDLVVTPDGSGGVFLAWRDFRAAGPEFDDIYGQHLDADGNMAWAAGGQPICTANYVQADPTLVADGTGGVYIAWYDERYSGFVPDLYVQRRMANGDLAPGFDEFGTTVALDRQSHHWPQLVRDGANGAVLIYAESAYNKNRGLFAKHISMNGSVDPSTDAGNVIVPEDNSSFHTDIDAQTWVASSDLAGGAWVVWKQGIGDANPSISNVYLTRVLADATKSNDFPVSGSLVRAGISKLGVGTNIVADGTGGAVVCWEEQMPGGFNIYAKRVDGAGNLVTGWADTGTTICSRQTVFGRPEMVADGIGGVYVAWADGENFNEYPRIVHLDGSGQVVTGWTAEGILPGPGAILRYASRPRIVSDGAGGVIITWIDVRNGVDLVLYSQRLTPFGTHAVGWPVEGNIINNTHTIRLGEDDEYFETFAVAETTTQSAIVAWRDYRDSSNPDQYLRSFENTLYAARATTTLPTTGPDLSGVFQPMLAPTCKTSSKGTQCKFKAAYTLSNTGDGDSGPFVVRFFASTDGTLSGDDLELKPLNLKKLKVGQVKNKKLNVKMPLDVQASGVKLFAEIDQANTVVEIDETNNEATAIVP